LNYFDTNELVQSAAEKKIFLPAEIFICFDPNTVNCDVLFSHHQHPFWKLAYYLCNLL